MKPKSENFKQGIVRSKSLKIKVIFLDDDVLLQKDLTTLWVIDMHGKVNGAMERCGETFYRLDKYLNFSNPLIVRDFDPNSCTWAYGMNIFDFQEWKK